MTFADQYPNVASLDPEILERMERFLAEGSTGELVVQVHQGRGEGCERRDVFRRRRAMIEPEPGPPHPSEPLAAPASHEGRVSA